MLWFAVPKRRHVILRNLELCFPELSRTERESLAKRVYVRLARAAIDHGTLWCGSAEDVRSLVHFHGIEHLLNPENRPVIVVSPHFAGLDAAGIALNTYVRGVSLYQTQSNPVWDEALLKGRLRFSNPVLIAKSGDSDLRRVMRENRLAVLLSSRYGSRSAQLHFRTVLRCRSGNASDGVAVGTRYARQGPLVHCYDDRNRVPSRDL